MKNRQHGELSRRVTPWDYNRRAEILLRLCFALTSWSSLLCRSDAGFTGATSGPQRWTR